MGEEEWKGKAMNHNGDGNKMVSETPRTDAVYDVELLNRGIKENGRSWGWGTVSDFRELAKTLERELARCNNLYRKLDVHTLGLCDVIRELESKLNAANERIRLLIAERDSARAIRDQNWKMREEFTALLGTDDVEEGVRRLQLMKAQQISTTQTK